eukprot:scaffold123674_cov51-Attheya_sp.AAC.1
MKDIIYANGEYKLNGVNMDILGSQTLRILFSKLLPNERKPSPFTKAVMLEKLKKGKINHDNNSLHWSNRGFKRRS